MKTCILGAGALGCAIGAALTEAGDDVWLVSRSAEHVDAMNRNGLRIRDGQGERSVPVKAARDCTGLAPVDLLVVLVKSFDTRDAIAAAAAAIGPATAVLSLQNGMGHEDILMQAVGRDKVLAGKTYVGGVMLAPGHIVSGIDGKSTVIGELDGAISVRVQAIAAQFNRAGLATTASADIRGAMWDKLLINVATSALSGITRLAYGDLYAVSELQATAQAAVAEAIAVAHAAGVALSCEDPEQAWLRAAHGLPSSFKASMLQSLEKGSITEIDFIHGAVVRIGAQHGIATPVNATLVACIKGIEHAMAVARAARELP